MEGRVVGLGVFDGVHLGHGKLLNTVKKMAREKNMVSAAITFFPHPLSVVQPEKAPLLIDDLDTRKDLIMDMGIDEVHVIPFSNELANKEPRAFFEDILIGKFNVKAIGIGFNYVFGRAGAGNITVLKELGDYYGVEIAVVPPVKVNGQIVGSTLIRKLIKEGCMERASRLLGRRYCLKGKVIKGYGRGKDMGFPTANLQPFYDVVVPADGVYICNVYYKGSKYCGVCNIGKNPTFGNNKKSFETHIIAFDEEIYEQRLIIEFHKRIRDEKSFDDIEGLKKEINRNVRITKEYFNHDHTN